MRHGPCKGCPERKVGCHGGCQKYQEYRSYCLELQQKKQRDFNERDQIDSMKRRKRN